MLARIIFFVSVSAAILAVVLLATVSPIPKRSHQTSSADYDWISLSLYVQPYSRNQSTTRHGEPASAYVFRHRLTMGPDHSSPVVGTLIGFVLPHKDSLLSSFNIVHLAMFNLPELSGSLCIEVRQLMGGRRRAEQLAIVGGTGSFAFSSGNASLVLMKNAHQSVDADSRYLIKLRVGLLPDRNMNTIPG
ncbi:Dirigent-like protein [Carex littledalei]|uniref:Dirigent protein n=1 Tax=Carex littledalei TaxID=544730 RepID=A0A833QBS8_9POAL|nr:Dirigent-like protein [Carex littledalei]